jgi:hypothetical protein
MKRAVSSWPWILLTGCGASFSSTAMRTTPVAEGDVYACAVEQIKQMGYETLSHNDRVLRLVATRENPTLRRSDPTFRKGHDRLIVEAHPASEANGATLRVTAQSVLEYFNRRGQTFEEIKASPQAREAADTLLNRCARPEGTVEPPS